MLYAVAKIAGKQYKVVESSELTVDRLPKKVGETVNIDDVLLVVQDDTKIIGKGADKAKIKAKVVAELLASKVLVLKYKKRKRYRKLVGHRQQLTRLKIETIDFPGKKAEPAIKKAVGSQKSEAGSEKPKATVKTPKKQETKTAESKSKTTTAKAQSAVAKPTKKATTNPSKPKTPKK